jgi:hypothetical protein
MGSQGNLPLHDDFKRHYVGYRKLREEFSLHVAGALNIMCAEWADPVAGEPNLATVGLAVLYKLSVTVTVTCDLNSKFLGQQKNLFNNG